MELKPTDVHTVCPMKKKDKPDAAGVVIHAFFFIRKLVVLLVQDFLKNSTNF